MEGYSDLAIAVKECYIKQISLTTLTANQVRRNIIAKQWCGISPHKFCFVFCAILLFAGIACVETLLKFFFFEKKPTPRMIISDIVKGN